MIAAGRTYNAFQMRIRRQFAIFALALLLFGFDLRFTYAQTSPDPSIVTIDGLGKGTVDLSEPWRFHIGDNLQWADPSVNDSPGQNSWETILTDRPWGAQNHYAYAGFAWYRLRLRVTPAPDIKTGFQLLLPRLQDVCEVYWNGRLVGRYGKLPPHPSSPVLMRPQPSPCLIFDPARSPSVSGAGRSAPVRQVMAVALPRRLCWEIPNRLPRKSAPGTTNSCAPLFT